MKYYVTMEKGDTGQGNHDLTLSQAISLIIDKLPEGFTIKTGIANQEIDKDAGRSEGGVPV